jgi:hypothetical protein
MCSSSWRSATCCAAVASLAAIYPDAHLAAAFASFLPMASRSARSASSCLHGTRNTAVTAFPSSGQDRPGRCCCLYSYLCRERGLLALAQGSRLQETSLLSIHSISRSHVAGGRRARQERWCEASLRTPAVMLC